MTSTRPAATTAEMADLNTVYAHVQAPDLEWVEVAGQVVAWTSPNESLHVFDEITSIVFQLMDGRTPLFVSVAELAGAFGTLPAEILDDVQTCVGILLEIGAVWAVV